MYQLQVISELEKTKDILNSIDVSEDSLKDYKYHLSLFFIFLESNSLNIDSYLQYKRYLQNRVDLTVSSKNKYLITAKVWLKEAYKRGYISREITGNVKGFQNSRKHKRQGVNESEVKMIFNYLTEQGQGRKKIRLQALFSLLAMQGLRQCEIIRLNVSDFDYANKRLFVRGKGSDDKEAIDLHPVCSEMLKSYCDECKIKDGALFPSFSNNNRGQRITTRAIRLTVKQIFNKIGISTKSAHGFRHYFTTTLIDTLQNLAEVRKYTRHKSYDMLQVYYDNHEHKKTLPAFYEAFGSLF